MNKRAFTLTELIAVIIIISLILLTAVPAVYKLLSDNKNVKYDYYYQMVEEATYAYAKTKTDELGNSLNSGCISVEINDLISNGFLKAYNKDNETVNDSQIIINNDYGKITIGVYLKIGNYSKGVKKNNINETCIAYNPNSINTLGKELKDKTNSNGYITNKNNNYVWYSGKLWRIILVDNSKGYVKLVTDDTIGTIPFNLVNTNNNFDNSYIDRWLNEYFLKSIYNPDKYLVAYKWVNNNKKIGLLTKDDLVNYASTDINWTLTPSGNDKIYISKSNNDYSYSTPYGVKPAIVMKSSIRVVDGDGGKSSPYQLEGNKISNQKDKMLKTRYSGEYVQDKDGDKYRIVSISSNYVKLISENVINNVVLTNVDYTLSTDFIDNLNTSVNSKFNDLLKPNEWYLGDNSTSINYVFGNINTNTRNLKVGLPMFGEIFSNNTTSSCIWTLTKDSSDTNKLVTLRNNATDLKEVNGSNICKVKYMLYIDGNTKIIRGSGIFDNPFIIVE